MPLGQLNYSLLHFYLYVEAISPDLYIFFLQQLLQQATSTTNQGSFNGLQRLGSELAFSCVSLFCVLHYFGASGLWLRPAAELFLLLFYTTLAD